MARDDGSYTGDEKKALLALARESIAAKLRKLEQPHASELPAKLLERRSCFVTLHVREGNALRGCIGNIEAFEPLADNVQHNALNSAFDDPRFNPVGSVKELDGLRVEISVLTPPEKIPSYDKFVVGEHGIIIRKRQQGRGVPPAGRPGAGLGPRDDPDPSLL